MKIKLKYVLISLAVLGISKAQVKQFALGKGNSQLFNGKLYSYGLLSQKQNAVFCIYQLDFQLRTLDSIIVEPGKSNPESYLQIYSDTLHDYLNVYLQKKEKKVVAVLRFNKKFELIATIENVDVARLNNTSMFSSDVLYFKNTVYSIKTESDTSGKQFYLNKYMLKSETTNFDYEFRWQFPFERKNIHAAHVFFANKSFVLIYVTVIGGVKTGQWILKINAETGKLIKGTKLNDKGETNSYQFGNFLIDNVYRSIHLTGQKFTEAQFNQKENKLAISNAGFAGIYHIEIDSLGEIVHKEDLKIPINDIKSGAKKTPGNYILKFYSLTKTAEGKLSFESDIFKSYNNSLCYFYTNTTIINLIPVENKLTMGKNVISSNQLIEQFYVTPDKQDMNGKLCIDSLDQFGKLFYKNLTFPVKQQFKLDMDNNPMWILAKHTTKKNTIHYAFLSLVKKIYQLSPIEEINESANPVFKTLSSTTFLISHQIEEGKYQLKLYNW